MARNIVIVGAGYGGVLTAKKLAKKFKKDDSVHITIIDKNPFHTMLTELHEVAAARVDEDSIRMDLRKIFAGRRVNVVLDTVQTVDYDGRVVRGKAGEYPYDILVMAAGSKPTYFGVKGAEEHSFKLWSYEDAVVLRGRIVEMFRRAERETDPAERRRLLTFYVVGAGFTGVEMVGELAEYVPILCDKFSIDRSEVSLFNVDMLARPVPVLPERLSGKVLRRLHKMGVQVRLSTGVTAIGPDFIETKTGDTVERFPAGTVVWTAGIESADITLEASHRLASAGRGRIQVDPYLRSVDNPSVYVVGDNMMFIPEGEQHPVPQMVENCEQSAGTAARNIFCELSGAGEMEVYKPSFHGVMVSIGGRYGVAHVGLPNHLFSLASFFAMFAKHFINVIYFIQVLGWTKIFSYVKHEFFTIRNCRSFLGGHFSNRTPSFLLVPLRLWLGAVWVFEGVMKIVEGWMVVPKLKGFFGGANSWYDTILNGVSSSAGSSGTDAAASATPAAASAAHAVISTLGRAIASLSPATVADAASSATQSGTADAAASVGKTLLNFRFLGLFDVIFVSGKDLASSTLSDYAFKLNVPLINWFVNTLVLPYNGMQMFMQVAIVVMEILIGLALMGGLFTFPASAASLVLQVMFVCTTGLYLGTVWMVFAAIAVLIGGGRTLGLDYYVMPPLKKGWKRLPFIRKWYLYND